jgi:hypothetical protein
MTQRWIRRSVRGVVDVKNLNRAAREGWKPVQPDSLPEEWQIYAAFANKSEGIIVVDDMQLMEIPTRVIDQKRKAIEDATRLQMEGVEHDLERSQVAGHPILRDHKSSVSFRRRSLGRPTEERAQVAPADDD